MSNTDVDNKANRFCRGITILPPLKFTEEEISRLDINALHGLRSMKPTCIDRVRPHIRQVARSLVQKEFIVQLPYTFKLVRIFNLDTLLAAGTKPIDAVLCLNASLSPSSSNYFNVKIKLVPPANMPRPPVNKRQIGMDVLVLYLLLVRNCTVPVNDDPQYADRQLPLTIQCAFPEYTGVTMGMMADHLSLFNLKKIRHDYWIKKVDTSHYNTEGQHHLIYTVPSYRLLRRFVEYTIRLDADENVKRVSEVVKVFITRDFTWDCHPVTKTLEFKETFSCFDQSLCELILLAFSERQLARMRYRDYIPPLTEQQTTPENRWRNWTHETFAQFQDYIFPRKDDEN